VRAVPATAAPLQPVFADPPLNFRLFFGIVEAANKNHYMLCFTVGDGGGGPWILSA